jgi:hypothetical protein
MAKLVHESATVVCAHQGQASPSTTDTKVKVGGQGVVVQSASYTVSGCVQPSPPNGNGPCITAQLLTAATKIQVGGSPVVLSDSNSLCTPTGTPLQFQTTQQKVEGV